MSGYYDNKRIVITGGGSGIGKSLAKLLANQSSTIIIADKNRRAGTQVVRDLNEYRADIKFIATDMTDFESVQQLFNQVTVDGNIDIVFNCVGIVQGGEVKDTPLPHALDVIDTNMHSTINSTHIFYRHMVENKRGHIVNFGSAAGLLPTPMMAFYTASKYGIVGFSHALRIEASLQNVRISVVCPGFVRTPIYETAYYDKLNKNKVLRLLFHKIPIQEPEDAARKIINKVARNRMTIHTWKSMYVLWVFYRISPPLYIFLSKMIMKYVAPPLKHSN